MNETHGSELTEEYVEGPVDEMLIAVVGAHLKGQPLHGHLLERGARFVCATTTAPRYALYALPDTSPPKPALMRVAEEGHAIEVEVYALPLPEVGGFLATIPAPLGLGTVELVSDKAVYGFICEPVGIEGAADISDFGGWRAYMNAARGS